MEKRLRYFWPPTLGNSWCIEETYIKVKGQLKDLYCAVDAQGNMIDFYLSSTRNIRAAKRILGKVLRSFEDWQKPQTINTDKASTYAVAIKELKEEEIYPTEIEHQQVKYLNNIVESDQRKLKRLIKLTLGFKSMKTPHATIKGFELIG